MKNRISMTILLCIIILGTAVFAAGTKKSTTGNKKNTVKKRREPQSTKIKYKKVIDNIPQITFVKAEEIVLAHAGLDKETADVTKILMEQRDKELVYKIIFRSDSNDYNYLVSSNGGKILNYSQTSRDYLISNKNFIGNEKVAEIILEKISGAKNSDIYEMKIEKENDLPIYKGRAIYNGKDYRFTIDALKGNILKSEETVFSSF
ncbi:MAG: PepSY domain-containing protein [Leptotrichiaceae bacterium]|nr:PepSY domain-containing protein [Leptotrichiaceae bacterium]